MTMTQRDLYNLDQYPGLGADPCLSRHQGNPESTDAYLRARDTIPLMRRMVLNVVQLAGARGATSKEIALVMERPLNAISGRITELVADGLIRRRAVDGRTVRRDGAAVLEAT